MDKRYFISYKHRFGIGHLCYTGTMTKEWLTHRLFDEELVVLFISEFNDTGTKSLIAYMENGVYKNKMFDFCITGVDDLNKVWITLNTDDNDISILSFKNITYEYEDLKCN